MELVKAPVEALCKVRKQESGAFWLLAAYISHARAAQAD